MKLRAPCYSEKIEFYSLEGDENVVKYTDGTYICSCDSVLDECEHIKEFKEEEAQLCTTSSV